MDLKRKQFLEGLHARPSEAGAEENFVIDYLTKLQQNGEMQNRLAERIAIIKTLAGEQFTAGWPTLPELLKIAAGKGGNRFIDKSTKKQKKKKRPVEVASSVESSPQKKKSIQSSKPVVKKPKIVASTASAPSACNIYLRSAKMQPLRVGSARAVEKILSDFGLPLKPKTPTTAIVEKYDRLRSSIIQLIDARKAANKHEQ
jgi:DNA methyltransferase 1-associated protein 1